jgi:hypothetical protein
MSKHELVSKELTQRAAALGANKTLLDYVCDEWLSGGKTVIQLAEDLTKEMKVDVSRDTVRRVIYASDERPAVEERLNNARAAGASILVEEAQAIADSAAPNRDAIAKARMQVDIRTWIAGKNNRAQFGDQKSVGLTINIGQLHLDALRRSNGLSGAHIEGKAAPLLAEEIEVY